jgi:hypothetical protein
MTAAAEVFNNIDDDDSKCSLYKTLRSRMNGAGDRKPVDVTAETPKLIYRP